MITVTRETNPTSITGRTIHAGGHTGPAVMFKHLDPTTGKSWTGVFGPGVIVELRTPSRTAPNPGSCTCPTGPPSTSSERSTAMRPWKHTIDIADVWNDQSLTFEQSRDTITARIKASNWYQNRDAAGFDEFGEAVDNLADAETESEFDNWWDVIYDHADRDRAWIKRA